MFTIIGGDGKEYGPVSSEQIRGWMAAGRANLETQIRREGETEWKRLGDFAEFVPPVPPLAAGTPVVAGSKPIHVDVKAYSADLIARAPKLPVFAIVGEALRLWTNNFWSLVGVTLLVYIALIVSGFVPFGSIVLGGVFIGGLFYFYLGKLRGERREFGDGFAGFSRSTVSLLLAGLVITGLMLAMLLPFYALFFGVIFAGGALYGDVSGVFIGVFAVGAFLLMLPVMYFSVCWHYTYPLVIDKNIAFWDAMGVARRVITAQWWRVFAVSLVAGFIVVLGLLGLFVGILLTLPIAFCAVTITYERLFNPPPRV